MGDPGSGSWYRSGKKYKVEEVREIDVRRWQREGFFGARPRYVSWGWYRDGERIASIGALTSHSKAELSYSCWQGRSEDNKQNLDYAVPITWTACNFGGGRPWFVCPGIVNEYACRRRVTKLYLSGGYLLCRHCHDLIYEARQVGRKHSALRKCQKIRQSLGGSVNMMEPFPPRPKGLHLKTYGTPGKDANVQQFESAYLEEEGQRCQEGQGSHEPRCIHGYPDGAGCYLCDPSHPYRPGRAERGKSEGVTQHEDTP